MDPVVLEIRYEKHDHKLQGMAIYAVYEVKTYMLLYLAIEVIENAPVK